MWKKIGKYLLGLALMLAISWFARLFFMQHMLGQAGLGDVDISLSDMAGLLLQGKGDSSGPAIPPAEPSAVTAPEQDEAEHREQLQRLAQIRSAAGDTPEFRAAFRAWYQTPSGCDYWETEAAMVRCSNHKAKAKRQFREIYSAAQMP